MRIRQTSTNQERMRGRRPKQTRTSAKRCKYCHTYRLCRRLVVLQGGQVFPTWVCHRCKQRIWGEKEKLFEKSRGIEPLALELVRHLAESRVWVHLHENTRKKEETYT